MAGVVASKVRKQRASMKKNKEGDEEGKTRDIKVSLLYIKVRITEVKLLVSLIQLNYHFSQIPVVPPSLDKGRYSRVSLQKHFLRLSTWKMT